jgi:shikimate kinase
MLCAQGIKACELFTGRMADGAVIDKTADYIREMTENIVLIGMAGCGKTTVGRILANMTDKKFVDADEEFTRCYGVTPAETIEVRGEDEFRNMETEILARLCRESGYVIACGGGVVTRECNRDIMAQNGKVVYNAGIVKSIVALAVNEVEGTLPLHNNKNGIVLFLEKDGIYADVSVVVEYGYNVPELAYRIQQSVKNNVETMTKYKVAKVDVHIMDVIFEDEQVAAPEMEQEETAENGLEEK